VKAKPKDDTKPAGPKEEPKKEPARPTPAPKVITSSIDMKLVWIEPGRFQMGSPVWEKGRFDDEFQHEVEISQGFYMGAYEVTQEQYRQVMGNNPSYFNSAKVGMNTDNFPVEQVSWNDAVAFCRKLTEMEKDTGRVYDLPTEAEWEYVCRAGTKSVFAFGDSLSSTQANFYGDYPYGGAAKGPYLRRTAKVGSYKPNAWDLYDRHGNAWELCKDWYGKEYYRESVAKDPLGPTTGIGRVLRGWSWLGGAWLCRSALRDSGTPGVRDYGIGFRVVVRLSPRTP